MTSVLLPFRVLVSAAPGGATGVSPAGHGDVAAGAHLDACRRGSAACNRTTRDIEVMVSAR